MKSFKLYLKEGALSLARHYIMSRYDVADPYRGVIASGETTHPELGAIPTYFANEHPPGGTGQALATWAAPNTDNRRRVVDSSDRPPPVQDRLYSGKIRYGRAPSELVVSHEMRHGTSVMNRVFKDTVEQLHKHDPIFQELVGAYRIDPSEKNRKDAVNHAIEYHNGHWVDNPEHPLHQHFHGVAARINQHLTDRETEENLRRLQGHKPSKSKDITYSDRLGVPGFSTSIVVPKNGFIESDPTNMPHAHNLINNVIKPIILHHTGGKKTLRGHDQNSEYKINDLLKKFLGNTAIYNLSQSESPTTHSDTVSHIGDILHKFKYKASNPHTQQEAHHMLIQSLHHNEKHGELDEHLHRFQQTGDAQHLNNAAQVMRHSFIKHAVNEATQADYRWGRHPSLVNRDLIEPIREHINSTNMSEEQKSELHGHLDKFMEDHHAHHNKRMRDSMTAGHMLATHHFGFEPSALELLHKSGQLMTPTQKHKDALESTIAGYRASQQNLVDNN